jgi:predicted DNA-binding ribbon-helix-helix protein
MTAEVKRSVSIRGHRTSVSLEAPFWDEVKRLAAAEKLSLAGLVARIDETRPPGSLSSAIRVYVLHRVKAGA